MWAGLAAAEEQSASKAAERPEQSNEQAEPAAVGAIECVGRTCSHSSRSREREREFYLTRTSPCGHKAADTAESSEHSMSVCLPGRSMYRSGGDLSIYVTRQERIEAATKILKFSCLQCCRFPG